MADDAGQVGWYSSLHRALLPLSGIHVSRSFSKFMKNCGWKVTFDEAFRDVILNCIRPDGNWITSEFVESYTECYKQGWAHSCEVWDESELVGGIYGLAVGGCFSAESMFSKRSNASKVALFHMVNQCRSLGFLIFDAQIINPHTESLGAFTVSESEFHEQLADALQIMTLWSTGRP